MAQLSKNMPRNQAEAPAQPGTFVPPPDAKSISRAGTEGRGPGENPFSKVSGVELFTPSFTELTSLSDGNDVVQVRAEVAVKPRAQAPAPVAPDGVAALTLLGVGVMKFGVTAVAAVSSVVGALATVAGFFRWTSIRAQTKRLVNELIDNAVVIEDAPQRTDRFTGDSFADGQIRSALREVLGKSRMRREDSPHVVVAGIEGLRAPLAEDLAAHLGVPLLRVDCTSLFESKEVIKEFVAYLEREAGEGGGGPSMRNGNRWRKAVLSLEGLDRLIADDTETAALLVREIGRSKVLHESSVVVATTESKNREGVEKLFGSSHSVEVPTPRNAQALAALLKERFPNLPLQNEEAIRISKVFGVTLFEVKTLDALAELNEKFRSGKKGSASDSVVKCVLESITKGANKTHRAAEYLALHTNLAVAESIVSLGIGIPVLGFSVYARWAGDSVYRAKVSEGSAEPAGWESVKQELVVAWARHLTVSTCEDPRFDAMLQESREVIEKLGREIGAILLARDPTHTYVTALEREAAVQAIVSKARRAAQRMLDSLDREKIAQALATVRAAKGPEAPFELVGGLFDVFSRWSEASRNMISLEYDAFSKDVDELRRSKE